MVLQTVICSCQYNGFDNKDLCCYFEISVATLPHKTDCHSTFNLRANLTLYFKDAMINCIDSDLI